MATIDINRGSKLLRAASHPDRLYILRILTGGETGSSTIRELTSLSQPTLSKHMKLLEKVGLVKRKKRGRQLYYRASNENIVTAMTTLTDSLN